MDIKISISVAIGLSRIREWLGRPAVRKAQRECALNTLVLLRDVSVHLLESRPAPGAPEADHVRQWGENLRLVVQGSRKNASRSRCFDYRGVTVQRIRRRLCGKPCSRKAKAPRQDFGIA